MPLFKKDETKIFFVHIPKTAGGSIEDAFLNSGWNHNFLHFPTESVANLPPTNPQHYHAEFLYDIFDQFGPFDFAFTIVRHPFTRLVSEAVWRSHTLRNYVDSQGFDSIFCLSLEKILNRMRDEYVESESSWRNNMKLFLHKNKYFPYDNHLRPQHHFLMDGVEVFRFEDLHTTLFKKLNNYGIKVTGNKHRVMATNKRPIKILNPSDNFKKKYLEMYGEDHNILGYELPW